VAVLAVCLGCIPIHAAALGYPVGIVVSAGAEKQVVDVVARRVVAVVEHTRRLWGNRPALLLPLVSVPKIPLPTTSGITEHAIAALVPVAVPLDTW
jgi:hypothetical protein